MIRINLITSGKQHSADMPRNLLLGSAGITEALKTIKRIYSLVVNVTNACNGGCNICLAFVDRNRSLPLADMMRVVDIVASHDVKRISFAGGEPMLYPHILNILRYAHDRGLVTALCTNGTRLTEEVIQKLDGITDEIMIPFSSTDPKIAMQMTSYATQSHLTRMEEVFKYILKNTSIGLVVESVLSKVNGDGILDVGNRLLSLGVKNWKIDQYYEIRENRMWHDKFFLGEKEFNKVKEELLKMFFGKITMVWQPAEPRTQNQVFFVSPAGQAVTNGGNENRVVGKILDPETYMPLFATTTSITPQGNYQLHKRIEPNFTPSYDAIHKSVYYDPMARSVMAAGEMTQFFPHNDFGTQLFLPPYVREAIYNHFMQLADTVVKDDDFRFVHPLLYSAGLGALGEHPDNQTFYKFESFWKWAPKTRITVKGPFIGRSCIYYLLCPEESNYFGNIRAGLKTVGINMQHGKEASDRVGWINVARTAYAVPLSVFLNLQQDFKVINNKPIISFVPIEAGPLEANWLDALMDGHIVRNMTTELNDNE
ncbi:hypothetical protein A2246_06280 [candidate division WOR-1 bacterium RIFOXYA2_FULL_37_7]|uniref:Radical SAM core domain-containing protein n=1 Tax=candidate division WOR-1 bacterium RIFOXYB2_FULL_37_13 TaxID=1802579 RepID=A0A1F4SRP4_UNCSA|nr:MAG: hypothetical protein A2246_06280 [candidate division WOR-1 bacterium RIFOXYA2_FULL_37_7]OGC23125.1 MAG: hypothetical protein A2310_00835 [candidate division WOR-1 bacterium RIFOXYB2_FULL_37_13]